MTTTHCPRCRSPAVASYALPDAPLLADGTIQVGPDGSTLRGTYQQLGRRCLHCLAQWRTDVATGPSDGVVLNMDPTCTIIQGIHDCHHVPTGWCLPCATRVVQGFVMVVKQARQAKEAMKQ